MGTHVQRFHVGTEKQQSKVNLVTHTNAATILVAPLDHNRMVFLTTRNGVR